MTLKEKQRLIGLAADFQRKEAREAVLSGRGTLEAEQGSPAARRAARRKREELFRKRAEEFNKAAREDEKQYPQFYEGDAREKMKPPAFKEMRQALMGQTQKLPKRTAGSQKIPGYGDVFAPVNEAFRKKYDREDERYNRATKQFEDAYWRF